MRIKPAVIVLILGFGLALFVAPARAGIDISFGASIDVGDDAELYVSISSRYFDHDPGVVRTHARHYDDPDDLAVALYLARRSGRSPDHIWSLRHGGMSWFDVSVRLELPVDVWFVAVRHDPGPPYGRAYGHFKRHKHDRRHRMVLTDVDVRHLTAVRMIHEYYGVPIEMAMEWRSSGRDLRTIMSGEYHGRHRGRGRGGDDHGHSGHGRGHGGRDDDDSGRGRGRGRGRSGRDKHRDRDKDHRKHKD